MLDKEVENDRYFIFICEADYSVDENGAKFLILRIRGSRKWQIPHISNRSDQMNWWKEPWKHSMIRSSEKIILRSRWMSSRMQSTHISTWCRWLHPMKNTTGHWRSWQKLPIKWQMVYGGADLSKNAWPYRAAIYGTQGCEDVSPISHAFIPRAIAHKKRTTTNTGILVGEQGWLTMCNGAVVGYECREVVHPHEKWASSWNGQIRPEICVNCHEDESRLQDARPVAETIEKDKAFREIERVIKQQFYYLPGTTKRLNIIISNVKAIEDSDELSAFRKSCRHSISTCSTRPSYVQTKAIANNQRMQRHSWNRRNQWAKQRNRE